MLPVKKYKQYWENIKLRIPEIKHLVYAPSEDYLQKKIKEIKYMETILVAIIPSTKGIGSTDAIKELHPSCLIYVIQKIDHSSLTDEKFIDVQETTQNILEQIKNFMIFDKNDYSNGCPMMKQLQNDWNEEPEYNYLSCNGYSLAFNLITTRI